MLGPVQLKSRGVSSREEETVLSAGVPGLGAMGPKGVHVGFRVCKPPTMVCKSILRTLCFHQILRREVT